ncbi:MAG: hypothetical protein KDC34_17495 [Saprospiraceae bacterium]|nr:hypothetical protein [Saprospiraceae bacterium]
MKRRALFIVILLLFVGHQVLQKGLGIHLDLLDSYLDPMLGMVLLLEAWRWEQKFLFQKTIKPLEVFVLCALSAGFFEFVLPIYHGGFTKDPADLIFYGLGGLIFLRFLNPPFQPEQIIVSG